MKKKFFSLAAVGVVMILGGGVIGCGTKTIIVQSNTESESNSTVQETTTTNESNAGSLSKIDSNIPATTPTTTETTTMSATEATTDAASNKEEYFFYDSDTRLLTESDLEGMSVDEMRLARNEIFARRGRKFKEQELQDYYYSKSWYKPTIDSDDFNANVNKYLNETEIKNAEFIKSVEDKIKSGASDDKQKVLDAIAGRWKAYGYAGSREFVIKGDVIEDSNGNFFKKITDVVRAFNCDNSENARPGEEGYMIIIDSEYYDIEYYYFYDNQPDHLELHTEDENGRHMSYGGDSLQRIK